MRLTRLLPIIAVIFLGGCMPEPGGGGGNEEPVLRRFASGARHATPKAATHRSPTGKKERHLPALPKRVRRFEPSVEARQDAEWYLETGDLANAEPLARRAVDSSGGTDAEAARKVLAKIHMLRGEYEPAAELLKANHIPGKNAGYDPDLALCYARLDRLDEAREWFSTEKFTRYGSFRFQGEDMPGTDTRTNLEASILLARGIKFTSYPERNLDDLQAASKLAPTNAAIAYFLARSFFELGRSQDAKPYFEFAAQNGHGALKREAQGFLDGIR
ncbi:MAG: CDC27 family protein [Fimbriimonadaceae bacterium]